MVINMYITLFPVILAGIGNMIFVKTKLYRRFAAPLDKGKALPDGKRILGDNKTGIGFLSMVVLATAFQTLWGAFCKFQFMLGRNAFYLENENSIAFNLLTGALLGFAYMLFELPNSFIKRRLCIADGKTHHGIKGFVFFIVDQIDSIIGVTLVLACFTRLSILQFLFYILLGGGTHIAVNLTLYFAKIRKNI